MTVTPEVAAIAAQLKDSQARMLDPHDAALIGAWAQTWTDLEPEFLDAVLSVMTASKTGRVSARQMAKSRKLAAAIEHALASMVDLLDQYDQNLAATLPQAATATVTAHQAMALAQVPESGIEFDAVTTGQLDKIVARTAEEITAAHLRLPVEVEAEMRRQLVHGIAIGENPQPVAARLVRKTGQAFNGGLPRATMIARTEMLDATREAAREWEKKNRDVLDGWTWICALDRRSCAACVGLHGSDHPASEPGPLGHQNCRCTRAPKTKTWAELGIPGMKEPAPILTGPEWFDNQSRETQDAILGTTRAELLRTKQVTFDDLITRRKTEGWRDSYVPTPIKNLKLRKGG